MKKKQLFCFTDSKGNMTIDTIDSKMTKLEKKIERLEEQLKSANKCIKIYAEWTNWFYWRPVGLHTNDFAQYYLKKWGVK